MSARRPLSWDEVWLGVAAWIGAKSNCVRRQVGCVIVTADNQVVATTYNGAPADMASEKVMGQTALCEYDCPRAFAENVDANYGACIAVHAEMNGMAFADRSRMSGGTMYITTAPCPDCTKVIANSGLARVAFKDDGDAHRPAEDAARFLRRCGIAVTVLSG